MPIVTDELLVKYFKPLSEYQIKSDDQANVNQPLWSYRENYLLEIDFWRQVNLLISESFDLNPYDDAEFLLFWLQKMQLQPLRSFNEVIFESREIDEANKRRLLAIAGNSKHNFSKYAVSILITLLLREKHEDFNSNRVVGLDLITCKNVEKIEINFQSNNVIGLKKLILEENSSKHLYQCVYVDVSHCNFWFTGKNCKKLNNLNLSYLNFSHSIFIQLELKKSQICFANLEQVIFEECKIHETSFFSSILFKANFIKSSLEKVNFSLTLSRGSSFDNLAFENDGAAHDFKAADMQVSPLLEILALENTSTEQERLLGSRFWPKQNKPWKSIKGINKYTNNPYQYEICELEKTDKLFEHLKEYVYRTSDVNSYSPMVAEGSRLAKAKQKVKFIFKEVESNARKLDGGPKHTASLGCIEITKIEAIKNNKLWESYQAERSELKQKLKQQGVDEPLAGVPWHSQSDCDSLPILDEKIGECWIFNGTTLDAIESIKEEGFKCREKKSDDFISSLRFWWGGYGALGLGFYSSDMFAKSGIVYTQCSKCKEPYCECNREGEYEERQFFICRAILGKVFVTDKKDNLYNTQPPPGYDSIIGANNKVISSSLFDANEILVPRKIDQNSSAEAWQSCPRVYPEYVVHFKRLLGKNPSKIKIEKDIKLPTPSEVWNAYIKFNDKDEKLKALFVQLCDALLGYYHIREHQNPLKSQLEQAFSGMNSALISIDEKLQIHQRSELLEGFKRNLGDEIKRTFKNSNEVELKSIGKKIQKTAANAPLKNLNINDSTNANMASMQQTSIKAKIDFFMKKALSESIVENKVAFATSGLVMINQIDNRFINSEFLLKKALFESMRDEYKLAYRSFNSACSLSANKDEIISFFETYSNLTPRTIIETMLKILTVVGELNEKIDWLDFLKTALKKVILKDQKFDADAYQKIWYDSLQKAGKKKTANVMLSIVKEILSSSNNNRFLLLYDRVKVLPYTDCGSRLCVDVGWKSWQRQLKEMFNDDNGIPVRWLTRDNQIEDNFLKQEIADQLFTGSGDINPANPQPGSDCFVKAIKDSIGNTVAYAKFFPRYPLRQLTVERLRGRLNGYNSYSTLASIQHPTSGKEYIVLFSKPWETTVFQYQFPSDNQDGDPELSELENFLDSESFFETIAERYILRYEDEKFNNCSLININSNQSKKNYRIMPFDVEDFLPASSVDYSGKVGVNSFVFFFKRKLAETYNGTAAEQRFLNLNWSLVLKEWWREAKAINAAIVGVNLSKSLFLNAKKESWSKRSRYQLVSNGPDYNGMCDLQKYIRDNDFYRLLFHGLKLKEKIELKVWKINDDIFRFGIPDLHAAYLAAEVAAIKKGEASIFGSFKNLNNDYKWINNSPILIRSLREDLKDGRESKSTQLKRIYVPCSAKSNHNIQKTNRGYVAAPLLTVDQFESEQADYGDFIIEINEKIESIIRKLKNFDVAWIDELKSVPLNYQYEFLSRLDYVKLDSKQSQKLCELVAEYIKPFPEVVLQGWVNGSYKSIIKMLLRNDGLNYLTLIKCDLTDDLLRLIATRGKLYELNLDEIRAYSDSFEFSARLKPPEFSIEQIECFKYLKILNISNCLYKSIRIPAKGLLSLSLISLDKLISIYFQERHEPEHLKSIVIRNCSSIRRIDKLPANNLEVIVLENLENFQNLDLTHYGPSKHLKLLRIKKCPKLEVIKSISRSCLINVSIETDEPERIYEALFRQWEVPCYSEKSISRIDKLIYCLFDIYFEKISISKQQSTDVLEILIRMTKKLSLDKRIAFKKFVDILSSNELYKLMLEMADLKIDLVEANAKIKELHEEKNYKTEQMKNSISFGCRLLGSSLDETARNASYLRHGSFTFKSKNNDLNNGIDSLADDQERLKESIFHLDTNIKLLEKKTSSIEKEISSGNKKINGVFHDFVMIVFPSILWSKKNNLIDLFFKKYNDSSLEEFIFSFKNFYELSDHGDCSPTYGDSFPATETSYNKSSFFSSSATSFSTSTSSNSTDGYVPLQESDSDENNSITLQVSTQ